MAKYEVIKSGSNVRTGSDYDFPIITTFPKGKIVTAKADKKQNGWLWVDAPGGWMALANLKVVEDQKKSLPDPTPAKTEVEQATQPEENNSTPIVQSMEVLNPTEMSSQDEYVNYLRAYGCPPRFSKFTDPPIYESSKASNYGTCGRVYAETFLSNASILSICPCNVKYLPGFNTEKKDEFYKQLLQLAGNASPSLAAKLQPDSTLSGKLYEATPAYGEFHNHLNCLARMTAIMDGIGDKKVPGTNTPYKSFDWSYYSNSDGNKGQESDDIFLSIAEATKQAATAAITDGLYLHFFVNQAGTSADESINTEVTSSMIEQAFSGELSTIAQNIQFLTGGSIDPDGSMSADIESVFNSADSNLFKAFGTMTSNYFKGGRIVFPQIVSDCTYSKSFNCSTTFISPYSDKESIFLRCKLPTLALMALSFPKQVAEDMYSVPFLCRVFQKGAFNSDLAVITGLNIKRGGSDDLAWSLDSQSTIYEVSFNVTPLYNKMMVPSITHPFLALGNNAMLEYLGTMCGIDLKANNIDTKLKLAGQLIAGSTPAKLSSFHKDTISKAVDTWLAPIIQFSNR